MTIYKLLDVAAATLNMCSLFGCGTEFVAAALVLGLALVRLRE